MENIIYKYNFANAWIGDVEQSKYYYITKRNNIYLVRLLKTPWEEITSSVAKSLIEQFISSSEYFNNSDYIKIYTLSKSQYTIIHTRKEYYYMFGQRKCTTYYEQEGPYKFDDNIKSIFFPHLLKE